MDPVISDMSVRGGDTPTGLHLLHLLLPPLLPPLHLLIRVQLQMRIFCNVAFIFSVIKIPGKTSVGWRSTSHRAGGPRGPVSRRRWRRCTCYWRSGAGLARGGVSCRVGCARNLSRSRSKKNSKSKSKNNTKNVFFKEAPDTATHFSFNI